MRTIWKPRVRPHRLALALAVAAVSLAAPLSGANAAIASGGFFGGALRPAAFGLSTFGVAGGTVFSGGPQTGVSTSGCGENRPTVIGSPGGTSAQACFSVLSFIGPSIGQINSQVGPTIIGSTILGPVTVSAGNVVNTVP